MKKYKDSSITLDRYKNDNIWDGKYYGINFAEGKDGEIKGTVIVIIQNERMRKKLKSA